MRYASLCSGIEAATVAWHRLGWTPVFYSEIEPYPCSLLAHHYPHVPNHGDMTRFQEWPDAALDLLVGGTPCQSFSIAGLRKGLADPRGNLMLTFGAIADRYRPRWLVWENVPGVLSSNRGRDFGTFLGMLGQLGYGFAYRVLDAQHFGVPQRRRRVFVVAHLGDWRRAAAVLFERHSLSGDPAPSRAAGAGSSVGALAGTSPGGGWRVGADEAAAGHIVATLDASYARLQGCSGQDANHGHSHLIAFGGNNTSGPIDVATAVNACASASGRMDFESETFVTHTPLVFDTTQITSATNRCNPQPGDPCHPLAAGAHPPAVAFRTTGNDGVYETGDQVGALTTSTDPNAQVVMTRAVRRLTPEECEALQGFSRGYTLIPLRRVVRKQRKNEPDSHYSAYVAKRSTAADGPRYKALGNSMAVPVMHWIGQRIAQVQAITAAQAAA